VCDERLSMRLVALILVFLTACDFSHPVADDRFARQALEDLQNGRVDAVRSRVDSVAASHGHALTPTLALVADSLRLFGPIDSSTKLIGWNVVNGVTYYAGLSYQLAGRDGRWGVATVDVRGRDTLKRIIGLGVSTIPEPLAQANRFTLHGKTPAHYLTLTLALLCAIVAVTTAVKVWRTPMHHRGIWVLIALFGFGTFQLNWSSGAWHLSLIHLQFLSAGFRKMGPYAPWIISFSLPIGALIALERRRRALRTRRVAASRSPVLEPSND